ncbi:MAG: shikimate dehydrogenase [Lachnospiraceae bacterium]|nr:shikimate dehydrogenase [Lachnospiraceae bacterium]
MDNNNQNIHSVPITGHTGLTCLLGSPVAHSISPLMHNEAFKLLGLDYIYLCFDVNEDNLSHAVNGLKLLNVKGFNCTMPVKNKMAAIADELSPAASMIGAVNTVLNDNGKLIGHNTDGIGYMRSLSDAGHNIIGKKMTLLGAGGAASSIFVQAALDGVKEISIFSRKGHFWDRAQQQVDLVNSSTDCHATLFEFGNDDVLYNEISTSDILTNATPVGMAPNTEACLIKDKSVLNENLIVSDIIYNPKETKLLRLAGEQGCKTINGLYMLLFQGSEAFKIWTGYEMPVDKIRDKFFSE